MSIYGSGDPVISSQMLGGEIPLEGTTIIRNNPEYNRDQIINKSIITGKKHIHFNGKHHVFKLTILNATRNLIDALELAEGTEVTYQPYGDNSNRVIPCFLTRSTPFNYKNLNSVDAVIIEMETIDYWQDTAATLLDDSGDNPIGTYEGYLIDENSDYIVDESGNKIIINQFNKED
jgi:hypothetical protein